MYAHHTDTNNLTAYTNTMSLPQSIIRLFSRGTQVSWLPLGFLPPLLLEKNLSGID